jgi:hypothetical protein
MVRAAKLRLDHYRTTRTTSATTPLNMTEPTNPLFDDEKEFLERKKLEYERALRGDVEVIKEQTIHVGKIALVGAGVASGIWLLAKAFGGGSKAKQKHKKKHKGKYKPQPDSFEDYAGFDGYEDENDHDQELDSLANAYHSPEYAYDHADRFTDGDDGFYSEGYSNEEGDDENAVQYEFGTQSRATAYEQDDDDNGLSDYPDFPEHSSAQHGDEASTSQAGGADQNPTAVYHTDGGYDHEEDEHIETAAAPTHSFASAHSYQARPYDDSRRLPESNSFADMDDEPAQPAAAQPVGEPATAKSDVKRMLVPTIMAFAQSETGKVVIAQVAAVAMAYAGKVLKDILPSNEAKAAKNTDLAASSTKPGVEPVAWPATTAAQNVSAAAQHDDALNASLSAREPLA